MPKIRTDEQVEQEIARLLKSPHVKMAQKEQREKNRRRKYLSDLLWLEKRGKEIEKESNEFVERMTRQYEALQAN